MKKAFTLAEIMIVLTIIGVLTAILLEPDRFFWLLLDIPLPEILTSPALVSHLTSYPKFEEFPSNIFIFPRLASKEILAGLLLFTIDFIDPFTTFPLIMLASADINIAPDAVEASIVTADTLFIYTLPFEVLTFTVFESMFSMKISPDDSVISTLYIKEFGKYASI